MTCKKTIHILIVLLLTNCANKKITLEEDLTPRFNKAMKYFNKEKFIRAKDEFDYIIMTNPGSQLANESQYYKGEALFQLKEFHEAGITYDHFIRFTNDIRKREKARYRLCECSILSSNSFPRDQKETKRALEQLQMFLEDFPQSELAEEAEKAINE